MNTMQSNNLYPSILAPTRISSILRDNNFVTTESLIDNIYLNTQKEFQSGILEISISDHYPIFLLLKENDLPNSNEDKFIYYRLINDNTLKKFKDALENNSEINEIFTIYSGQQAFSKFFVMFNTLYENYFPVKSKKLTRKGMLKPWITLRIITRIKIRDNLAKLANRNQINKQIFNDFRNLLTTEIREVKSEYYSNKFKENEKNIRETWRTINDVIKTNSKIREFIKLKDIKNDKNVSGQFVEHFTGIAEKVTSNLPPSINDASSYMKNRIMN